MSDVNYGISNVGTVMTSCAGTQHLTPYHAKLERVKFGVPLEQVCRPDLPGPLLVSEQFSQSGALSLVQILQILCSDWLNLTMLVPRSMP